MEDQFIIRPPEKIREKILQDVKSGRIDSISIRMTSPREGILEYNGERYNGALVDLPCIIESHKTMDNKQFIKIADISRLMLFSEEENLQKEVKEASLSGITPPMAYVKKRRFRKRLTKAPIVEEIEKAVTRLLNKDKEAVRVDVQIIRKDEEESEEDVSSLAAEIELNLMESERPTPVIEPLEIEVDDEEVQKREEYIRELREKISEKKEQIRSISNPILKKRFQESLEQLEQELREA